jgi:hypothetical protein
MSPSRATHDTLTRQSRWRGVGDPYLLLMPIVPLALGVPFRAVDTLVAKRAFDLIINDTTALSALVAITDDRPLSRPRHPYSASPPADLAGTPAPLENGAADD